MKKHILKNFLKGVVAVAAAFALASCSFLSVDDDSGSPSSSGAANSSKGAVSVSMFVPDYYALSTGGSARVVAPQTSSVKLGYKAGTATEYTYLDAVTLSDSEKITIGDSGLSGTQYKVTFSGIPVGGYVAGSLVVNLLDSDGKVVSSGTNSEVVTITEGTSATGSFYTIPTSSDAVSGSLSAGEMKFVKVSVYSGIETKLSVTVGESDSYPTVFIFDESGTYNSYQALSADNNSLILSGISGNYCYIGFYSATDISSYAVSISGAYSPKVNATDVYEDASLVIKFDSEPTVNRTTEGLAVKIYSSDGILVDTIKSFGETITSNAMSDTYRTINVREQLISVNGAAVVIKPHVGKLANSKTYYVNIDSGLLTGTIGGAAFTGISDSSSWAFTTRAAPAISGNEITVGSDKNFSTIQAALNYIGSSSSDSWTITVDEGEYNELLTYSGNASLTLVGNQTDFVATNGDDGKVVVYWKNMNGPDKNNGVWNPSSRQRMMFLWEGKDLTIKNMTFKNTVDRADVGTNGTQAETLYFDSTSNLVAYNSSFKSHQDTLLLGNNGGRGWFYKSYIEGDTDFIWGYPATMLFEECQLRCVYDVSAKTHTSYIFASRTPVSSVNANKGLVLFNSNISVDEGVTAYYGRNSGSDTQAAVVFNTFEKIDPAIWFEGSTKYDEDIEGVCSVGYKDYGNVYEDGNAIDTSNRVAGAYGLSKVVAEREFCGRNAILNRGWDASTRKYVPAENQWDLSSYETEFNASEDKSKSMIYIEPTYIPYLEGNATTAAFTATDYAGKSITPSYAIDNETFASVDSSAATVTAKENQVGTVILTATSGDSSGVATINVIKQVVEATGLAFDKTEAFSISKDDTTTLTASFTPADVTDENISWSSSDTNVLRVTGSGALGTGTSATVTGFGVGTATITATSMKTPSVSTSVEITVKDVYAAQYLQDGAYTKNASVLHRDQTIVANPVSYGFAGGVEVTPATEEIQWGNGGWPFASNGSVSNSAGADFAWADFTIKAAGNITLDSITATAYCSATSNERGIVYVKVGDGDFTKVAEAAAENKSMQFSKAPIITDVAAGQTAVVRVAIASTEGKTVGKALTGVIGNVSIYYTITGNSVAFDGADGEYNIKDYYSGSGTQWDPVQDGSSADGMVSWESLAYHSANYGAAVSGSTKTGYVNIKVGGASVISIVGSQYGNGTLTVTDSSGNTIAGPVSTKMSSDSSIATRTLSFLYTGTSSDTLKLAFTGTSYIGTITVKELTTEVAEVTSVKINGAETVSTASPSQFTATVETTYCAPATVTWTSSDATVATVDENGLVTGVSAGTATITATSAVDTTVSDSIEVEVTADELTPDADTTYTYNFKDSSSSDYVKVTAGTAGTSSDTFLSWNDKWNTHNYGIVNSSATEATLSVKVAGNVVVGFTGYNASSGSMKVTDADENVVLANMPMATGNDLTTKWFIYKGEATTLTLTSLSKDCYISTITVKPWTDEVAEVTRVSLSDTTVYVGKSVQITPTVTSTYFADESVTWLSSDTSVATIDENGIVTAVSTGTTTITATSVTSPSAFCSCTVTVEEGVILTNTYDFQNGIDDIKATEDATLGVTLSSGIGYQNSDYGAKNAGTATFTVAGPALITFYPTYKMSGTIKLYDATDTEHATVLATGVVDNKENDVKIGTTGNIEEYAVSLVYAGDAASLDLVIAGSNVYFWKIVVNQF